MTERNDAQAVESAFRALYRAMLAADADAMAGLLAEGCTLTHITGVVQPGPEWLADVRARRMVYHAAREVSLSTHVDGDSAMLVGRHVVDATIYGGRGRWNLQLNAEWARCDGRWDIARIVATTF